VLGRNVRSVLALDDSTHHFPEVSDRDSSQRDVRSVLVVDDKEENEKSKTRIIKKTKIIKETRIVKSVSATNALEKEGKIVAVESSPALQANMSFVGELDQPLKQNEQEIDIRHQTITSVQQELTITDNNLDSSYKSEPANQPDVILDVLHNKQDNLKKLRVLQLAPLLIPLLNRNCQMC
jgi:hypothetical protein